MSIDCADCRIRGCDFMSDIEMDSETVMMNELIMKERS